MARIGDVWDSTTDVLAGRAGEIAPIAVAAFVLPSLVQTAVRLYAGSTPAGQAAVGLIAIAALIVSIWGQLAVLAIAADPATTRGEAARLAGRRLPANLLVVLVLGGLVLLLTAPIGIALWASGFDFAAAAAGGRAGGAPPIVSPGAGLFVALYMLALFAVMLGVGARLFLVNAVVLNENRKLGAIGRSFALTRGMTWKLIGVALLFAIALLVTSGAVKAVVGLLFRLLLGAERIATADFVASIAAACVTAAWTVTVQVFAARLYAAVTGPATEAGASAA
jgi:hypothetical protein